MNHPERNLWKQVKDYMPGTCDRIENVCCPGMPDVNGTYNGRDYWIELKVSKRDIPVDGLLEVSQNVWHKVRIKHKCHIFVLVKSRKGCCLWIRDANAYRFIGEYKVSSLLQVLKMEINSWFM